MYNTESSVANFTSVKVKTKKSLPVPSIITPEPTISRGESENHLIIAGESLNGECN